MRNQNKQRGKKLPENAPVPAQGEKDKLEIVWKILPIILTVISIIFTVTYNYMVLSLSSAAEQRARQNQPLSYTLDSENRGMKYTFTYQGEEREIPAPTLKLHVQTGAICSVTPIRFDANGLEVEGTFGEELLDDKYYVTIDSASPGTIAYENGIAYDYFFLYIKSLSGEQTLDMVCNEIDLLTGEVSSKVYSRIDLLERDPQRTDMLAEMLNYYAQLHDLIEALPLME